LIDLGKYKLRALHTPGHTSGCLCLYEPNEEILFSGDTVFAKGTISDISSSGNMSDYVDSLQRLSCLKIKELYPGHGYISDTPDQDISLALKNLQVFVEDAKLFFEALARRGPQLKFT
jgi:glyoxylase-like metal-dependent hydrolase (beta-lactamase superfamily II)